jgi:lysophospholipase L1-like esterase
LRKIYVVLMVFSISSFLLFSGGFIWGVKDLMNTGASPLPNLPIQRDQPTIDQWSIAALGDSLTRGIGDSDGVGYVGVLRNFLAESKNGEVQLTNLSVSGATSDDLVKQLSNQGALRVVAQANLIVMTIGGNDLFHGAGDLQEIDLEMIGSGRDQYLANLKKVMSTIRAVNAEAPIYLLGLYNPFGNLEQSVSTTKIVMEWNFETQLLTASFDDIIFVPVADIFQGQLENLLYNDHFHPNHEGYRLIGNRLTALIEASLLSFPEEGVGK